jgi:hypothetical protein
MIVRILGVHFGNSAGHHGSLFEKHISRPLCLLGWKASSYISSFIILILVGVVMVLVHDCLSGKSDLSLLPTTI